MKLWRRKRQSDQAVRRAGALSGPDLGDTAFFAVQPLERPARGLGVAIVIFDKNGRTSNGASV